VDCNSVFWETAQHTLTSLDDAFSFIALIESTQIPGTKLKEASFSLKLTKPT
jgi:hypothetical protein